jgi:hypothetical protein
MKFHAAYRLNQAEPRSSFGLNGLLGGIPHPIPFSARKNYGRCNWCSRRVKERRVLVGPVQTGATHEPEDAQDRGYTTMTR